jgi:Geranylgeranyl pyrophosphate synthase
LGDDFKEGKITLPIILAYGRSNDKEKKFWKRTISNLQQENSDFDQALEIINKYQCIEDTITRANHFSNVAIDSIDIFKNNKYKDKLVSLVSTSIARIY